MSTQANAIAAAPFISAPSSSPSVNRSYLKSGFIRRKARGDIVSIVIVDGQPLWRSALSTCLKSRPHYSIVGDTGLGTEAVHIVKRTQPALLTLDLQLPDLRWDSVLHDIRVSSPSTAVVVVSACEDRAVANQCFLGGAMGYVVKNAKEDDILQATEHAVNGRMWCSPQIGAHVLKATSAPPATPSPFSPRELAILKHLADGLTNAEIASALALSKFTVQNYVSQIYEKIGSSNRCRVAELARSIVGPRHQRTRHDSEHRPDCADTLHDVVLADLRRIRSSLDDRDNAEFPNPRDAIALVEALATRVRDLCANRLEEPNPTTSAWP